MGQSDKSKNRRTAILLACLPGGIFTWLYTYRTDKKRFFRYLFSFLFWSLLTLAVFVLLNADSVEVWLTQRNIEVEVSRLLILIVLAALSCFTFLEGWIRALCQAVKRSEKWYKDLSK